MFNPAKELIQRLKTEEDERIQRNNAGSDEDEFRLEVVQPSGSAQAEEEPVTEIEHIHYEDDGTANNNETDSDDSD
jgi:RING finger protein 113A